MKALARMSATALALCASPHPGVLYAAAEALPQGPIVGDQDLSPFYRWTGALPGKPGLMLRDEGIPDQPEIVAAATARRILYTSTDERWRSGTIPVSGTLYLPKRTAPQGGWPLVAWAHGTLGVSDRCAPSWSRHRPRDGAYINNWLKQGFAVVATDYQGLGGPGPHPYLNWEAEGRSVLDAARAALDHSNGQIANAIIITGQSQGSGASLGATRLAPSYAPDLNIKASIATGIVSRFPDAANKASSEQTLARSSPPQYTILMIIAGALGDDAIKPDDLVTEMGKPLLQAAREGCTAELGQIVRSNGLTMANSLKDPEIADRLSAVMEMSPVRMPVPVFLATGLADKLITPQRQYAAVAALCAAKSHVVWKTYAGVTHNGTVHAAYLDELAFVHAALAGSPIQSNCDSISDPGPPGEPSPGFKFND
jgi:dienelactone hydrolase